MADPDYFTLAELTALPNMGEAQYTEAKKLAAAAYITEIIEGALDTSFVSRTITDEIHSGGCAQIFLKKPFTLGVTSATENGAAVTDTLRVSPAGVLTRFASSTSYTPQPWRAGIGNVSVTYEAGYSETPPADIKDAAMLGTREHLLATSSSAEIAERQQAAIEKAKVADPDSCGYVVVDAVVRRYKARLGPLGIA